MKFQEIISRLAGFSTPIFGVQWNPSEPQRAVARRVIAFLEDRRVLFCALRDGVARALRAIDPADS